MFDDGVFERNLIIRQATFFSSAAARGFSLAVIAARTEIPATTLSSYIDKPSRKASQMSLCTFIKLGAKLPELHDLLSMLIEDSGHDLVPHDPAKSDWMKLASKTSAFASHVCEAAARGHINHVDAIRLSAEIGEIVSEGQGVMAQ